MRIRVDVVSRMFLIGLVGLVGCSSSATGVDAPTISDGPRDTPHPSGVTGVGEHALVYSQLGVGAHPMPITLPALATHAGSTIVVSVGRGDKSLFQGAAPTDNKGNTYQQIDTTHVYTPYPNSGTGLYAATRAAGGDGHRISAATDNRDEVTLAAVEVTEGTEIYDWSWKLAPTAATVTSNPVTTNGSATLVAFWWGDANQYFEKTAVPNNGFTVVDSILVEGSLVQCAVAVKHVTDAGTYDVSWTASPVQGAQLWLVAVE